MALSFTHGASVEAVHSNGVVPVLKISMKCLTRVNASNSGSRSLGPSPGLVHFSISAPYFPPAAAGRLASAAVCPSSAIPQPTPATGVTSPVGGKSNTASSRGLEDIICRHFPPATFWLKYSVSDSILRNAARTRLA
jgi:hypothetical protein